MQSAFNKSMMNTRKKKKVVPPVWVPAYMLGVTLAIPMTLQIVHHVLAIQRNRDEGHILPKYQPQVRVELKHEDFYDSHFYHF